LLFLTAEVAHTHHRSCCELATGHPLCRPERQWSSFRGSLLGCAQTSEAYVCTLLAGVTVSIRGRNVAGVTTPYSTDNTDKMCLLHVAPLHGIAGDMRVSPEHIRFIMQRRHIAPRGRRRAPGASTRQTRALFLSASWLLASPPQPTHPTGARRRRLSRSNGCVVLAVTQTLPRRTKFETDAASRRARKTSQEQHSNTKQ